MHNHIGHTISVLSPSRRKEGAFTPKEPEATKEDEENKYSLRDTDKRVKRWKKEKKVSDTSSRLPSLRRSRRRSGKMLKILVIS